MIYQIQMLLHILLVISSRKHLTNLNVTVVLICKRIIEVYYNRTLFFLFIKHKMYKDLSSKGLAIPSNNFLSVFKKCEYKCRQFMPLVVNNNRVALRLFQLCYDEMEQLPVVHCGEDMCIKSIHYMLKLFIKIRIYHVVSEENRRISQPNMKRNKFMKVTHL